MYRLAFSNGELERVRGIEPPSSAWKAVALPLSYTRPSRSRRGQIQGTDTRGNAQVVEAMVPLANMFGYVNELRSFTQGRAQYTMQFSHYDEVPANVAEEVKAKLA